MARFGAFYSDSDEDTSSSSSPPRPARRRPSKPTNRKTARQRTYTARGSSESSAEESAEEGADTGDEEEEASQAEDDDSATQQEADDEAESTAWPKHLNLEPKKVNVMQSSLFRMPELVKVQGKGKDSFTFFRRRLPSDFLGEQKTPKNRTSFAQPQSKPPPRKYVRVSLKESVSSSNEGIFVDAGLSMGRSFRVGWGPGNKLVHVGQLFRRDSPSPEANSETVHITTLKVDRPKSPDLLEHLLGNSEMAAPSEENDYTPSASLGSDVKFSSLSSLYTTQDKSHCASVFRLCHALFDPIDLHLDEGVPSEIRSRIMELRRAEALSLWLTRAVTSSVEEDVKKAPSNDSARIAFLYLTGNQVEKATEVLMEGKNLRLATIVSQIPGNTKFQNYITEQLDLWRQEKSDVFMSEHIRRLYALAAGTIEGLEGSSKDKHVDIAKGLDWLRVLGLALWYSHTLGGTLEGTFATYESFVIVNNDRLGFPTPFYSISPDGCTTDGLFNLMKLSLTSTMTLESALDPLSFSPDPRDYRMPWFLYLLLSRCLRVRDFSDRQVSVTIDDTGVTQEIEGYSQLANTLTTNFAAQLEQEGLVQEAAYVLLFLEDEHLRKSAIRELLSRSGPLLNEYVTYGLTASLRIPAEWIDEAKATHAFYSGDVYLAYELYKRAKAHQRAHELAISYLAPEAVLRGELEFLTRTFTSLDASLIEDFNTGGQLFIDYARIVSRVPGLREKLLDEEDAVPDAAEASELETLSARIPKLIEMLPDVLHDKPDTEDQNKAALSRMLSRLLECVDPSVPLKVDIPTGLVEEGARIKHIHASAYSSFMRTIEEMA